MCLYIHSPSAQSGHDAVCAAIARSMSSTCDSSFFTCSSPSSKWTTSVTYQESQTHTHTHKATDGRNARERKHVNCTSSLHGHMLSSGPNNRRASSSAGSNWSYQIPTPSCPHTIPNNYITAENRACMRRSLQACHVDQAAVLQLHMCYWGEEHV